MASPTGAARVGGRWVVLMMDVCEWVLSVSVFLLYAVRQESLGVRVPPGHRTPSAREPLGEGEPRPSL